MNCKNNLNKTTSMISLVIILLLSFNLVSASVGIKTVGDISKVSTYEVDKKQIPDMEKTTTTIPKEETSDIRVSNVNKEPSGVRVIPVNITKTLSGSKDIEEQTLKQKVLIYKTVMGIPRNRWVKVRVVKKLIVRRNTNYRIFEKIVNASKTIPEIEDKEILTEELLDMDEKFTSVFTDDIVKNKPEVRKQVRDYIHLVKTRKKIKVRVDERRVKDLFNRKMNVDELMNWIWKSI